MDRTVIVTGGSGGLGVPVVRAFLDADWRVVVPWVAERELDRLPEREGLELVEADLFDAGAWTRWWRSPPATRARRCTASSTSSAASPPPARSPTTRSKTRGPVPPQPAPAVPHRRRGDAAPAGRRRDPRGGLDPRRAAPVRRRAGYCSSKAAVIAFVGCLDAEYKDDGVRANAILPSIIDTPGNRASQPDADTAKWVKPGQIAQTVLWLCSDASSATSGAAIPVYGRA